MQLVSPLVPRQSGWSVRERGYIEGQNIAFEYRYGAGRVDRVAELAAEMVRLKVDMIVVVGGTEWIRAARNVTKTIPILMTGTGTDPIEAGLNIPSVSPNSDS